jgi:hypothetical protein
VSSKNTKRDPAASGDASADNFDPTHRDDNPSGSNAAGALVPMPAQDAPIFADVIPSKQELNIAARETFGLELPDEIIRTIIHESEEIAHSTRRIMQEHMRIGGNVTHIMARVQDYMVGIASDTQPVRDRAAKLVYDYVQRVFKRSRSTVRCYMNCYEKFANNTEAVQNLGYSDMLLLLSKSTTDDVVEMVIEARKKNPDLSKLNMKKLVKEFTLAHEKIAEKDTQIEAAASELENVVGQLDETQRAHRRLMAEHEALKQDVARNKEGAESTRVTLGAVNGQITALQQQLANTEKELGARTRELSEATARVQTKEVPVPTVPEPYSNLQEAITASLDKLNDLNSELEAKKAELSSLKETLAADTSAAKEKEAIEKGFNAMVQKFGAFVQDYHSTQLLVTSTGLPAKFTPLLQALSDLVGKFHGELKAAIQAG